MSAPTLDVLSLSSFALALVASATGSLHCLGMCGPIRWMAGNSAWSGPQYQAGRLLAYLALGLLAGSLGAALPLWALGLLVAAAIALNFVNIPSPLGRFRARAIAALSARPWLTGFVSAALPCGLLHAWIAAAAATASPVRGAALLFCLWLGTVPALEASVSVLKRPMDKLRQRFPRALPVAILLLALIPIGLRFSKAATAHAPVPAINAEEESCPFH